MSVRQEPVQTNTEAYIDEQTHTGQYFASQLLVYPFSSSVGRK